MKQKLGIASVCQKCRKPRETSCQRTIYTKNYMGPCGDSFCYASCSMEQCHPVSVLVCAECAKLIEKKGLK